MQEMFGAMKAEAIPLGERLTEQERELDRLFAGRTVTLVSLEATLLITCGTITRGARGGRFRDIALARLRLKSGMNSLSPGTVLKRAFQLAFACSMRSKRDDTKTARYNHGKHRERNYFRSLLNAHEVQPRDALTSAERALPSHRSAGLSSDGRPSMVRLALA
jgi:hypothetical protein